ncbi:MAG: ABC transporter permease [Saprospiraceae bacterium]
MYFNNFRLAFRNLLKNGRFTLINLVGMAVGMACCFLIAVFLDYESHFDRFFPNLDRLYRVHYQADFGDVPLEMGQIPAPIGPLLPVHFPQVEQSARLFLRSVSVREPSGDRAFEIENAVFADSTVQAVMGFKFLAGNPATALDRPFSIVLTKKTALLLFGNQDPMGRTLRLANEADFTVTGLIRDLPRQSHLSVDLLVPFRNIPDVEPLSARKNTAFAMTRNWVASYTPTYVLLKKEATASAANALFAGFMKQNADPTFSEKQHMSFFPVRDIHQHSIAEGEVQAASKPEYLRIFGLVGLLILLIAGINFVNLSTAVYLGRTREVAVRKALGAGRPSLVRQFLSETMLLSFAAFLLALLILFPAIIGFNAQTGKFLDFDLLRDWRLTALFASIFIGAGLLAGIYPALFATRFRPIDVFRQNSAGSSDTGGQWLRKSLITVQFAVGIALLIGTLVMVEQLRFWRNQPMGFDGNSVVTIPLASPNFNSAFAPGDSTLRSRMNGFEEAVLQNPNITDITLANVMPGLGAVQHPIATEKIPVEDNLFLPVISVDYDFSETFRLQFVAGRDFDKSFGTDHMRGFIINELAVTTLGWKTPEEAIGQRIARGGGKVGEVVGVVKNFHTAGLQNALDPLVMEVAPGMFTTFAVRLGGHNLPATLSFLEKTWPQFFPGKAFEYHFLQDDLAIGYEQEQRLTSLCADFAGVAIFLSCFGLFGLISFTVRQRAKEIGIRKVLGASVAGITGLLAKDFLKLVVLAILIASPVAYYFMNLWLADFAYRIDIEWWMFVAAGSAAVAIAFLTVSFQSVRAALANPVESLRSE